MYRIFLVFALIFFCFTVYAQPGDPGGDPDNVPITGIEILIATGALFGVKKLLGKSKNK